MLRVLHVLNSLNRGGVESFIMNVYRNIDRDKVQFDFLLVGEKSEYDDEVLSLGGRIYRYVNKGSRFKLISVYDKAFKELAPKYDVVHIHAMSCKVFIIAKSAKKYGVKNVIVHSHGCYHHGLLHAVWQMFLNNYTDIRIACSDIAGDAMFGKKRREIKYVNNAIDTSAYAFDEEKRNLLRTALGIKDCFACINVGRFSEQKNHKYLLDIFKNITEKRDNAKLFLIGWGEEENNIRNRICELGLNDNVIVLGARDDVSELLNAMDAFILPSLFEGLPIVAIEAQTNGLPVFLSDCITRSADITGLLHYLPLSESPLTWAEEILKNDMPRKDMSGTIAEKGYDIKKQADELAEFYLSLQYTEE